MRVFPCSRFAERSAQKGKKRATYTAKVCFGILHLRSGVMFERWKPRFFCVYRIAAYWKRLHGVVFGSNSSLLFLGETSLAVWEFKGWKNGLVLTFF